jgi:hypothetical protein
MQIAYGRYISLYTIYLMLLVIDYILIIKKLRINAWMVTVDNEEPLEPLTNMTSLIVTSESVPVYFSDILDLAPNLKELHIQSFSHLWHDFEKLGQLTKLESFITYGIKLEKLKSLNVLKEKNLRILGLDAEKFDKQFYDVLGNFDSVVSLSLIIGEDTLDLTPIFSMPNLEILYLSFRSSVAKEDFEKWFEAAYTTKLSLFVTRNEFAWHSAWQKIYQFDKWMWYRLGNREAAHNTIIREISSFKLLLRTQVINEIS